MPSPNIKDDLDLFEKFVKGKINRITDPGDEIDAEEAPSLVGYTVDDTDVTRLSFADVELVKRVGIPFDHRTAQRLINFDSVPGERILNDRHVLNLATAMKKDLFIGEIVNLAVCHCAETGKVYRINGQHCSWARLSLPEAHPTVRVTLNMYRSDTLAGVRALYAQYDRGRVRGSRNVIESYLAEVPTFAGFPMSVVQVVASGLALHVWPASEQRTAHGPDALAALMVGEYKAVCVHVLGVFGDRKPAEYRHLKRAAVTGAMVATFGAAVEASRQFWAAVRDGTGLTVTDDPRLKLRNDLMRVSVRGADSGTTRTSSRDSIPTEALHRTCLVAWNAWREGKPLLRLTTGKGLARPKAK